MAEIDIEAIEKRAAAASDAWPHPAGETSFYDHTPEMLRKIAPGGPWHRSAAVQRASDRTVLAITGPITDRQSIADADFYANAKVDVAALIAEVRRLEAILMLDINDATRCDACQRVFDVDEGEYGEDCWLCSGCAAAARSERAS